MQVRLSARKRREEKRIEEMIDALRQVGFSSAATENSANKSIDYHIRIQNRNQSGQRT